MMSAELPEQTNFIDALLYHKPESNVHALMDLLMKPCGPAGFERR